MKTRKSILGCLVISWFAATAFAADFQAKVIQIADGDTITVLKENKRQVKIRLNGIDCPERGQAYGKKATEFTKDLVALQMVIIETFGHDQYGRTIGEIFLKDGRNLNHELVKYGWCWWYREYAPGNLVLKKLEADAKEAKLGLWNDSDPIPPWEFRHGGNRATLIPEASPAPLESGHTIRGNKRSKKYHRPDCPSYDQIAPHNRVPFASAQIAENSGYVLAGNCPH